ncbi:Rne/Rng family ribonuclease [Candidatus Halobeggiatoa sp. HSG11]|nr:Rne/Rng family ribonuclease [Candidatus Halobeggiatoa sp. HSG11]
MSQEILISNTAGTTQIAVIKNNQLAEIIVERNDSLLGNIYKGQITRVLPGMKAAFVDIGLKQPAFLQSDCSIYQGQILLTQVIKEPIKNKQARLTTKISIPSRYIVLLPYSPDLFKISNCIKSVTERQRLKNIILSKSSEHGIIIRTAAEGVTDKLLLNDLDFVHNLWQDIKYTRTNSLIYKELPMYLQIIRDLVEPFKIKVDSPEIFKKITKFDKQFESDIDYYSEERPLFDLYSININRLLEPKVKLDSGGYLIIESTEAMTVIDVNTGSYIGKNNLAETILTTNLEAAITIANQLKLRSISGIIIIDFIDMRDEKHKQQVLDTLKQGFINEHVKISKISKLGLVEMSRKYTRDSLEQVLCESCSTCEGRGILPLNVN